MMRNNENKKKLQSLKPMPLPERHSQSKELLFREYICHLIQREYADYKCSLMKMAYPLKKHLPKWSINSRTTGNIRNSKVVEFHHFGKD